MDSAATNHDVDRLGNDWHLTLAIGDPQLRAVAINRVLGLADNADPGMKHEKVHEDGRTAAELAAAFQAAYLRLAAERDPDRRGPHR